MSLYPMRNAGGDFRIGFNSSLKLPNPSQLHNLRVLDLSNTRLNDNQAKLLVKAIRNDALPNLETLRLGDYHLISPQTICALIDALNVAALKNFHDLVIIYPLPEKLLTALTEMNPKFVIHANHTDLPRLTQLPDQRVLRAMCEEIQAAMRDTLFEDTAFVPVEAPSKQLELQTLLKHISEMTPQSLIEGLRQDRSIQARAITLPLELSFELLELKDAVRVARRLEHMLDEEFTYSSASIPLKAWAYSCDQIQQDIEAFLKIQTRSARLTLIKKETKALKIFNEVKTILSEAEMALYSQQPTPDDKVSWLKTHAVNIPLSRVRTHNCFGIIIYAALLEKVITGKGTYELLDEMLSPVFKGGGLIYPRGSTSPARVLHCLENISAADITRLDDVPLTEGAIVIFSSTQAGTYQSIASTEHFYAHVACVGRDQQILDFWDGSRLNRRDIKDSALQTILEHQVIHVTIVDPPWRDYKL